MADNIREEYEKLKKKYPLPNFEDIDNEFEISLIEHKEFLLREIKNKIFEKIDSFAHFTEHILQPDTNSMSEMIEYRFVDDKEKTELLEFYKKLMKIHREIISLAVENNDKKSAAFISSFIKEWPFFRDKVAALAKKLSHAWVSSKDVTYKVDYLG